MTVAITGGCGFIGGHLASYLAQQRLRVVVVDELEWPGRLPPPPHIEWVPLDITDFDRCVDVMRAVAPQVVFHLAATSTIDSAYADPYRSLRSNIGGTINVLEAARVACPDLLRFVLTSTDKVYGELVGDSYVESSALAARGVYDVGKMSADNLVQLYGDDLGLPVSTLRLCNVFGPGDRNTGTRVVPRSLSRLFDPAGPLPPVIYETSMAHGRDYVYVSDVVRASAAVAFSPQARGEVFNMTPAAHRATLDLVEEIIACSVDVCAPVDRERASAIRKNGYEIISGVGSARALERQHCDASKLMSMLGFRNAVSLSEGLRVTITASMEACGMTVP
ncbi:MAG: NAD-dependent epimerase/dehydratase family protein [Pseudonocardia sp.]